MFPPRIFSAFTDIKTSLTRIFQLLEAGISFSVLATERHLYLSTNIPAWTAWTMLLNLGFSSLLLSIIPICRVKVEASQSRTSEGTASDWMSLSSSSVSRSRLSRRNITRTLRPNLKSEPSLHNNCSSSLQYTHRCKETKFSCSHKREHHFSKNGEISTISQGLLGLQSNSVWILNVSQRIVY